MFPTLRSLHALLVVSTVSLFGCTNLLGDFSYDPNADKDAASNLVQGDIVVTPATGLVTSEQGAKATFTIVLKREPTASVAIALTTSNAAEGTINPSVLSFTSENFAAPQMAQITGVDDELEDGPQRYSILTSPATSEDKSYHGIDPLDPEVTNIDDDTAGFTVMPPSGLVTNESGGETQFTIQLNHAPTADVVVSLSSDNPAEGSVSPVMLTFTALNWMAPQVVTVTGVDDDVKDGPQTFHVVTSNALSADGKYDGLDVPDMEVINQDNDSAGVILSPSTGLLTSEALEMTSLTIALSSPPSGNVTIGLTSSDLSEGTVAPESVVFTPSNWMAPQTVSITGVDDDRIDGSQPYQVVTTILGSEDPDYAKLEPPNADVTNIDDDTPNLRLTPTEGLLTGEDQAAASFTVELTSRPNADVWLDVASSRPEEGVATPALLHFTEINWNAPQVVTVMGVDDQVADKNQAYVVHVIPNPTTTLDANYAFVLPQDVALTNIDDDSAGVTVSPQQNLFTTEAGGTATFGVKLTSQPKADVSIALRSSNTAEGTVSPDSLTFTPDNYRSEQLVTIRGVNDSVQDGGQPFRILTDNATSADSDYQGMEVPNVDVVNVDDDSAGITVQPNNSVTLTTGENGSTATFTVKLNSQPTKDVSFSLSSTDAGEGLPNPTSLTFTSANWNAVQTVTIKGVDDSMHDGPQPYRITFGAVSSQDPNYANLPRPLDVKVTNTDNDSPGFGIWNAWNLTTTEKNNGTATFQVVLHSEPSGDVKLGLSSSRTSEGKVSPATLTFTPINWAAPQTVTITGVNDDIEDGSQTYFVVFAPATSTDKDYQGLVPTTGNVIVTNIDDDSAGIRVTAPPGLSTKEPNGTTTFTVELNSQPTADVTIPLKSSKTTEGTVSPANLVFTSQNWNAPKVVTLTGADDDVQDGDQAYSISIGPATSNDAKYKDKAAPDLQVTNQDNDTAKILVSAISGDTTEKGGTASFTIALQTQPTADVVINVTSLDMTEGTVSPAKLTFTPVNWKSPQKVTVTGEDDKMQDGDQPFLIDVGIAMSQDANYQGKDPPDVTVTNKDDDTANITVSKISGNTSEKAESATFTIVLDTPPSAGVKLNFKSSNVLEGTLSSSSVAFTTADWSSPQTVTVTGVEDDGAADGNQKYTIDFEPAVSTDKYYNGKQPASVAVVNVDNDSPGITVSAATGETSEDGDSFTFTVVLTSKPKADVQIPISSDNTLEGTVSTSMLTFTTTNWAAKQSVTVKGVNDDAVDGSPVYTVKLGTPTTTDTDYADIDPPDVSVTNIDNDTAGFTVSKASGNTSEAGGNATFTIKLTSKPKADVTIKLGSNDKTEGTLTVTEVVLTPTDWNTLHTITVHGENDDVEDGAQPYSIITEKASSTDPDYDMKDVPDVAFVNDDNDTAGYTVTAPSSHTSEAGGTATFTVALKSEPSGPVSIPLRSSNILEGTLMVSSVDFTVLNWKDAQTITVYGVNDDVADGGIEYSIVLDKPTTTDAKYAALDPPDVILTNDDDADSAALNVTLPALNMTGEAAGAATVTFSVVLTSKPKGTVTLPLTSSNEVEGIIISPSPATLVFDASNWDTEQSVTVQGVDDAIVDMDQMYSIKIGPPESTDSQYAALGPQVVNLVNVDDDGP